MKNRIKIVLNNGKRFPYYFIGSNYPGSSIYYGTVMDYTNNLSFKKQIIEIYIIYIKMIYET